MSLTSACAGRRAPNSFAGSAPYLDAWLLRHFDPENVEATIEALTAAQGSTEALSAQLEAARRTLADCDERLAKYRTALEAGTDPVVVTAWLREVQGTRLTAEREPAEAEPTPTLSRSEVRAPVEAVGGRMIGLDGSTPEQRAALYCSMDLRLTFQPDHGVREIECRPGCVQERVGGPTCNFAPRPVVVEGPWSELCQAA